MFTREPAKDRNCRKETTRRKRNTRRRYNQQLREEEKGKKMTGKKRNENIPTGWQEEEGNDRDGEMDRRERQC